MTYKYFINYIYSHQCVFVFFLTHVQVPYGAFTPNLFESVKMNSGPFATLVQLVVLRWTYWMSV